MPKGARLTRADFTDFSGRTLREHGRFFTLVAHLREDEGGPRAACVVSKKMAARAVDRNKIKRRTREALHSALKGVVVPFSIALYAKKTALDAPLSALSKDIVDLVGRAISGKTSIIRPASFPRKNQPAVSAD